MNSRFKGFVSRFLLLTISVCVTLGLVEVFLHFFHPIEFCRPPRKGPRGEWASLLHRASSVPGLSHELVPNREKSVLGMQVKTNSYGMRDREPLPRGTANLVRIIVLGDSITFGFKVPMEKAYPIVLEDLLNGGPGPQYDVVNLGVTDYATRDEAIVLRVKGLLWDPDLVILGYCLNDAETNTLISPLRRFYEPAQWWQHFHLTRWVVQAKQSWDVRKLGGGDYFRYLHAPGRARWQTVVKAFSDIGNMTRERGIAVLVVIFPSYPETIEKWKDYCYKDVHRQVEKAAKSNGFDVLDLYEVFSSRDLAEIRIPGSDCHPSELGHLLAAQAIRDKILGIPSLRQKVGRVSESTAAGDGAAASSEREASQPTADL